MTQQPARKVKGDGYSRVGPDLGLRWPPTRDDPAYYTRKLARDQGKFLRAANGGLYLYRRRDRSLIPVLSNPGSAFFNLMLGLGCEEKVEAALTRVIEQIIAWEEAPPLRLLLPSPDGTPHSAAIRSIKKKKTSGGSTPRRSERLAH